MTIIIYRNKIFHPLILINLFLDITFSYLSQQKISNYILSNCIIQKHLIADVILNGFVPITLYLFMFKFKGLILFKLNNLLPFAKLNINIFNKILTQ